jgi:hypothetical protein
VSIRLTKPIQKLNAQATGEGGAADRDNLLGNGEEFYGCTMKGKGTDSRSVKNHGGRKWLFELIPT